MFRASGPSSLAVPYLPTKALSKGRRLGLHQHVVAQLVDAKALGVLGVQRLPEGMGARPPCGAGAAPALQARRASLLGNSA